MIVFYLVTIVSHFSFWLYCYQVQGHSAYRTTSQYIRDEVLEARNTTLFKKLADQEDGRLMSQNNHLMGAWMLGSFIEQRGEGGEEVK